MTAVPDVNGRGGVAIDRSDASADGRSSVKSARRVLGILELLGANADGLKFPQIADLLGLPKSSLHALLATMQGMGWISIEESTRTYRIGMRAWEVGQGYNYARDLARIADEHLHAARTELNETVQLGILDGTEVLYIARVDSNRPFRLVSRAGMRLPAWATGLGKVLLADLPPAELRRRMADVTFQAFTDKTVRDIDQLERILAQIRADGIGLDDGEHVAMVYCVAAPVRDKTGAVVAAMSCSLPEPPQRRPGGYPHFAEVMARHARGLSRSLGWDGATDSQRP